MIALETLKNYLSEDANIRLFSERTFAAVSCCGLKGWYAYASSLANQKATLRRHFFP